MTSPDRDSASFPSLQLRALEDRLTASWQAREPVAIETLLADVPASHQAHVFSALLLVELTFRRHALAQQVTPEPFLTRFPQFAPQIADAFHELAGVTPAATSPANASPSQPSDHTDPPSTVIRPPGQSATKTASLPKTIGRFRVLRRLGSGGFGDVYLAEDGELDRLVAIKVPNARALQEFGDDWSREAKTVAQLKHPHIVPVFDVGSTTEFPAFIVSEYIEGCTLADRLKQSPLPLRQAVQLVIDVAEALDYAHRSKAEVVHRDIKPGNLLLDQQERVYVADFGLAIREIDLQQPLPLAGTPAYMSPEQIRGEGHRIDGRTDIFSLGVVLYELLTGRRPFKGSGLSELRQQVTQHDPKPPRQINAEVHPELERICLKALAKFVTERYSTAQDLADDLRQLSGVVWGIGLAGTAPGVATPLTPLAAGSGMTTPPGEVTPGSGPPGTGSLAAGSPGAGSGSGETPRVVAIVPKGLRSFDKDDAGFFLELLPGARDRDGLPESLRFWKQRIDPSPDGTPFSVGLLLGASGCGKSSLVKAGLLPRLDPDVLPIYLEATPDETERQLLAALVRRLPRLAQSRDLVSALATVRRGEAGLGRRKLLLVLDQFEQWLHAHPAHGGLPLTEGLRQCQGDRLQCLLLVRQDYAFSVTRFLLVLEAPLKLGDNWGVVPRFGREHAAKVLTAFGRAFGQLPREPGELSADQQAFVEGAIEGLAEEEEVVPVRLALFAEMFKSRRWTAGGLLEVGGAEGVGRAFLEQTFQAEDALPQYQRHAKGARKVLEALLPEVGSDIKGHWRSRAELLAVAGYEKRPAEGRELLRILDTELRLVSPVENKSEFEEGEEPRESAAAAVGASAVGEAGVAGAGAEAAESDRTTNYHLTHDYLVPSLRRWLEELLGRTPEGRAKLLLRERSRVWNTQPLNRHLPTLAEHLQIRRWTKAAERTEPERKLLARAAVVHGRGTLLTVTLLLGLALGGWWLQWQQARRDFEQGVAATVAQLETAQPGDWARVRAPLSEPRAREVARRELEQVFAEAEAGGRAPTIAERIARLTIGEDRTQVPLLQETLLAGPLPEFLPTREPLEGYRAELVEPLWQELRNERGARDRRLRAGMALAGFAPSAELTEVEAGESPPAAWTAADVSFVVAQLLASYPDFQGEMRKALRPVAALLLPEIERKVRDESLEKKQRNAAALAVVDYAGDQGERLKDLLLVAKPEQLEILYPAFEKVVTGDIRAELVTQVATLPPAELKSVPRIAFGKGRAHAATMLLRLGEKQAALKACDMTDDPEALSQFMLACRPRGVPLQTLLECLDLVVAAPVGTYEPQVRYALLIALGEYPVEEVAAEEREQRIEQVAGWYLNDPSSTVHGACGWLLRQWGATTRAEEVERTAISYEPGREWYTEVVEVQTVEEEGGKPPKQTIAMTFIVFPAGEYDVGSEENEAERFDGEHRHRVQLTRAFAVLDREITYAELSAFNPVYRRYMQQYKAEPSTAGGGANWYRAVEYCRWLGSQHGLLEEEQCYAAPDSPTLKGLKREPNERFNQYPQAWPVDLGKKGYRLPTEAEWEVAARSLAMAGDRGVVGRTAYGFGSDVELLTRFGWYQPNSGARLHVGRERLPGLRGMWDMHGNVLEWVHDLDGGWTGVSAVDPVGPQSGGSRVIRGGSWSFSARYVRCATRDPLPADIEFADLSFRLVRVPGS